jgi:hypothetical protein
MKLHFNLAAVAIAAAMLAGSPLDALAKAHHEPMAPPWRDACAPLTDHAKFLCLHPSYRDILIGNKQLAPTSGGGDCHAKTVGTPPVVVIDPVTHKDTCGVVHI